MDFAKATTEMLVPGLAAHELAAVSEKPTIITAQTAVPIQKYFSPRVERYLFLILFNYSQSPATKNDLANALVQVLNGIKDKSSQARTETEQAALRDLTLAIEIARRFAPATPEEKQITAARASEQALIDQLQTKLDALLANNAQQERLRAQAFQQLNLGALAMGYDSHDKEIAGLRVLLEFEKLKLSLMPKVQPLSDQEAMNRYLSMTTAQKYGTP